MRITKALIFLISLSLFTSCIGDDFIDDRVDERISINNPISEIQLGESYQIETTFFNNIGVSEVASFRWISSNPDVISITDQGLATAHSLGTSILTVSVLLNSGNTVSEQTEITVLENEVDPVDPITKSGTIQTTSFYVLRGDFTISEIENSSNLDLQIMSNYQASSSLPGLYLYLSNNPNSINGAYEIGAVQVFSGAHSYEIPDTGINDFKYLLYWCKPFSVKVGDGEIND